MYDTLTYKEILEKDLRVMDLTAAALAEENNLNTIVFNLNKSGNILKAVTNGEIGTTIRN
jgi:uridylate kinase